MDKFKISQCRKLEGEIKISGSKNAALPIMAATLLAEGNFTIKNIPDLRDIKTMIKVLEHLGAEINYNPKNKILKINTENISSLVAPYELVKTMRASALVLGPLLTRFGNAEVSMPGGCAIGARPVNIHLHGFSEFGADIEINHGYIKAISKKKLKGNLINLEYPSVGATENLIMAATLANGKTDIINAAREPEIIDLANFLNKMGAKIYNAGTNHIEIVGVKKLNAINYKIIPDRIEAGTFMIAGGLIKNNMVIKNADLSHLISFVEKLKETGIEIKETGKKNIQILKPKKLKPISIKTMPYPGFPTDMQAQMCVLLSIAEGTSLVSETVFENRFMHISELNRLGSDIVIDRNLAKINGVSKLNGAKIMATDLRASAALVLAGLIAEGETEILRVYHIDRGYEHIEKKFSDLGAKIIREKK